MKSQKSFNHNIDFKYFTLHFNFDKNSLCYMKKKRLFRFVPAYDEIH